MSAERVLNSVSQVDYRSEASLQVRGATTLYRALYRAQYSVGRPAREIGACVDGRISVLAGTSCRRTPVYIPLGRVD